MNLPAALSFRRVTLLHVVGPLALLAVAGLTVRWLRQPGGAGLEQVLFEAAIAALLAVALWLFLTAATDAPRAVLERCTLTARQRSSVGALTYYTCGPLALSVPLGLLCIFLGLLGTNYVTSVYGSAAVIAAFLVPLAIPLAWIFALARLAREGLGRSEFSVLRLSLSLWARWCWAAIVFLGLLPFGGLYIAVALLSMLDG